MADAASGPRLMLRTEERPVWGTGLADLSQDRLRYHLSSTVGDDGLPGDDAQWCARLCDLGFMIETGDGPPLCTLAGLVLFGHAPRQFLPQAGVRWMAFEGKEMTYRALDDRLIDCPLIALRNPNQRGRRRIVANGLVETLIAAMRPFVSEESDELVGVCRVRYWRYPEVAIREAIVNAVAHRDWNRGEETEVVRYADRLEVTSPGAFDDSMTVEKMVGGQRSARNPLIVETLRDYSYVDARGMGVRTKIIPLLRDHNGTEPEFIATEDYLRLVMRPPAPGHPVPESLL